MQLRDRTVWLIGASSGIGAALAPMLAAEGARLAISARRAESLAAVADAAAERGTRPIVKPVDVTDLDAIDRVYGELLETWGKVDVLFYNAATTAYGRADNFDVRSVLHQIDVNLLGLVRAVGTVMPDMIARREGEIVGTASIAGYAGLPGTAGYSASKAADNAFLQALRIELRRFGVGVTTINPGYVLTPMTEQRRSPMPFLVSADEAAARIVKGLLAGEAEIHFPKRLSWPAKIVTGLPRPVFELLARALVFWPRS